MAPTVSQLILTALFAPKPFATGDLPGRHHLCPYRRLHQRPETNHAIAMLIREAIKAREEGKEKVILMNWSGHGW